MVTKLPYLSSLVIWCALWFSLFCFCLALFSIPNTVLSFGLFMKIMILLVLPKYLVTSGANYAKNLLRAAVLLQYLPRILRFLPLLAGQSSSGFIFESAWANFVINLLIFVLAGHVVGSCWYLFGLQVSRSLNIICTFLWSGFIFVNHFRSCLHSGAVCFLCCHELESCWNQYKLCLFDPTNFSTLRAQVL